MRIAWFHLLAVQGTLKSRLQHHSSEESFLRCSAFYSLDASCIPYLNDDNQMCLEILPNVPMLGQNHPCLWTADLGNLAQDHIVGKRKIWALKPSRPNHQSEPWVLYTVLPHALLLWWLQRVKRTSRKAHPFTEGFWLQMERSQF